MRRNLLISLLALVAINLVAIEASYAQVRGIYLTQSTAENSRKMNYLIKQSKEVGISTFVIDMSRFNSRYNRNIAKVKQSGIRYVARIVVFPHGGTHAQVTNRAIWEKRWRLAQRAIHLGASAIQLDYIRYNINTRSSKQNAQNIYKVIEFFKHKMKGTGVKLQIDIFGVAAHQPSRTIGQNVPLFANLVDTINPMVYPSHYEPFRYHAQRPYRTVLDSVSALKRQLRHHPNVNVFSYIELYNYRYPMSRENKIQYIRAQIAASRDAGANGWYAWSANNKYGLLFYVLRTMR
ncbi:MAG: putative glycoside hydrolase [Gammaproteobacteria bacterium]|nr:putative glycoside hydrolase [Gammaproteobacteria bacterium]MCH9744955.1 putative glycoside hydrolase [Gammaproteobacteria bacterium]